MPPPRWARVCDATAIAALALGAFVLLFGGFAATLGPLRLSVRSADRILFIAIALIAVRHVASPAEPLHRRIAVWARALRGDDPGPVAAAALLSRIAVVLVAFFAVVTVGLSK